MLKATTVLAMSTATTTTHAMSIPRLYWGTMTYGWSQTSSYVDDKIGLEMMEKFIGADRTIQDGSGSGHHIDAARIYAGEDMVGTCLSRLRDTERANVLLGTKAHPSQKGGLSAKGIQSQIQKSLNVLGGENIKPIHEYYLHQPDTEHSLSESLEACHQLVKKGVIRKIGMSNYHVSEVERAFQLCREHDWTAPSVYQGLYNPLNRAVEAELLPLLREHSCSFVAYNPLAAGLLTGKHTTVETNDQVQKGRFLNNPNYMPRFYTPANLQGVELIRKACNDAGISMVEATYRWLLRHSALQSKCEDGVLLGASSIEQLEQNLNACRIAADPDKGALPPPIVDAFEEAWKLVQKENEVFPYWRSYSSDMPNRDELDPGASYDAAKKKT